MGLDETRVGRFDPVPSDGFDYLYGAESSPHEAIAIQETLRSKLSPVTGQHRVLPLAELEKRILVKFRTLDRLVLADIRTQEGREAFGAMEELNYHENRDLTREWGSYIRLNTPPFVCGIAYNATQATAKFRRASFILWRDRVMSHVFDVRQSRPLHEKGGIELVVAAFGGFNLLIT